MTRAVVPSDGTPGDPFAEAVRSQWPQLLAALIRFTGSPELAEDCLQEACARALDVRERRLLLNPAAWLTTTAKRIAIDQVRRDAALRARLPLLAQRDEATVEPAPDPPGGDDRLELVLLACHPDLSPATRLALALRFVLRVPTHEVADVLLVERGAMNARLTRAKRQVEQLPHADRAQEGERARVDDALAVVHALYTLGHTAPDGPQVRRGELTGLAIALARALRRFVPEHREVAGLLALVLLSEARAPGRTGPGAAPVALTGADRSMWDSALVTEGLRHATFALAGGGRFALQAGIEGLHAQAPSWELTDWAAVRVLYDGLVAQWPAPSALLARAVAIAYQVGPLAGLAAVDELAADGVLRADISAVRAHLLRLAGQDAAAREAYDAAIAAERNEALRAFLAEASDGLPGP
ncbi:MAG: sigma-70 family RNA polymerase sigma factor [Cellulomonas sp.]|nr:sigma-70 family RNA polymerase sigma factor [Cellulomonas sp.]